MSSNIDLIANGDVNASNSTTIRQELVQYEKLLDLFVCPNCKNYMRPPMLICKKGHMVCSKCKSTCKSVCPTCKQRISDTSNYMMELVSNFIKFPCEYQKKGCPEKFFWKDKTSHQNFCPYRPVHCQYEENGCPVFISVKDMDSHIISCGYKKK